MSIAKGLKGSLQSAFTGMANSLTRAFSPITYIFKGLEGFMGALEPLADLAETIGEILGTSLNPIVREIIGAITPFLPILVGLAQFLGPILLFLFEIFNPLGRLISIFNLIMQFVPPDIAGWITNLPTLIGQGLSQLGEIIGNFFTVTLPGLIKDALLSIGGAWNEWTKGGFDRNMDTPW